jgi:hypothetical protein
MPFVLLLPFPFHPVLTHPSVDKFLPDILLIFPKLGDA